jgi:hypothetical protein
MTRQGRQDDRVARTLARMISELTHLETVMREENVVVPTKVRAGIAHVRVWCRDAGRQHQRGRS